MTYLLTRRQDWAIPGEDKVPGELLLLLSYFFFLFFLQTMADRFQKEISTAMRSENNASIDHLPLIAACIH